MRKIDLPTGSSKKKVFFLIGILLIQYLLFNYSYVVSLFGGTVLNFVIKPITWLLIIFLVWYYPRVQPFGKLKHRGYFNWWALNFAILFVLLSLFIGFFMGLGKSPYSHSIEGLLLNLLLVSTSVVGREFVRGYLVNSLTKKENYLVFLSITFLMTIINIPINRFMELKSNLDLVTFFAEYFGPEFSQNLLATYFVFLGGPIPAIIYLGILEAFHWFSPILPDFKWMIKALVGVLLPVFYLLFIQNDYLKVTKEMKEKDKEKEGLFGWFLTSLASIAIVWFAVGLFPIYPSVIATGSMEPMIKPGDIILVKKTDGNQVKVGDVIQFRRDDILISHRIIEVVKEKKTISYRTKGDNNSGPDQELVKPEQIKGTIVQVVPKIGWPTLLLKKKENVPLEKVQF